MKTDEELKMLAVVGLSILKIKPHPDSGNYYFTDPQGIRREILLEWTLFYDVLFAPYFAHLALQKMEKNGWKIELDTTPSGIGLFWQYSFQQDYVGHAISEFEENQFVALYSAIEKTEKK